MKFPVKESGSLVTLSRMKGEDGVGPKETFVVNLYSVPNPTAVGADTSHTVDEFRFISVEEVVAEDGTSQYIPTGQSYTYYPDFIYRNTINFASDVEIIGFVKEVFTPDEGRNKAMTLDTPDMRAALSKMTKAQIMDFILGAKK